MSSFNREQHGSLYDRGGADSYYGRQPRPHWYPNGTYRGEEVQASTPEEIAEYMRGYNDNEASGNKKEW